MIARLAGLAAAAVALAAIWYGVDNITVLRGTWAWDYRWVLFTLGVLLGLSLIDTTIDRLGARLRRQRDGC